MGEVTGCVYGKPHFKTRGVLEVSQLRVLREAVEISGRLSQQLEALYMPLTSMRFSSIVGSSGIGFLALLLLF